MRLAAVRTARRAQGPPGETRRAADAGALKSLLWDIRRRPKNDILVHMEPRPCTVKSGSKRGAFRTKNDNFRKKVKKAARFALPILTFSGRIVPHGPKTAIRNPKPPDFGGRAKIRFLRVYEKQASRKGTKPLRRRAARLGAGEPARRRRATRLPSAAHRHAGPLAHQFDDGAEIRVAEAEVIGGREQLARRRRQRRRQVQLLGQFHGQVQVVEHVLEVETGPAAGVDDNLLGVAQGLGIERPGVEDVHHGLERDAVLAGQNEGLGKGLRQTRQQDVAGEFEGGGLSDVAHVVDVGPEASRTFWALPRSSSDPPTRIWSLPSRAACTLRMTGASR